MGKYINEAFAQLDFALRLFHHVEEGKIDLEEFNAPLRYEDDGMVFVCSEQLFASQENLHAAVWNNVGISFGAAAITFNRVREELGHKVPDPIDTEADQLIALVYQIRNAFAHDISEPRWRMNNRYQREYRVGSIYADLTDGNDTPFEFQQVGGPDALKEMYDYGRNSLGIF